MSVMRRETATIGSRRIAYLTVEPAPGPPQRPPATVVFLHAFPLHSGMWEDTLHAVPEGWRALAPDLRGLGGSSLPDPPHRMSEIAGDVVDLLDTLGISQAAVVGCSMGGYVAFELMRSAPGYVAALVLASTKAGADSEEGRNNRRTMIQTVDREGVAAVAGQMVPKLIGQSTQREQPDLAGRVGAMIRSNGAGGVRAAIQAMMERPDSTPLLSAIEVPSLVVHGADDTLIPPAEAEVMHRGIRGSRLHIVPSSGHLPNLERPEHFNTALRRFLASL